MALSNFPFSKRYQHLIPSFFLALLALQSQLLQATPIETTLTLSGKIMPNSCNISIANNGLFDYGDIPSSSLATTGKSTLQTKSSVVNAECSAPTFIALRIIDNRELTAYPDIGIHPDMTYGLGLDAANNPIGYNTYRLMPSPKVDGVWASYIRSSDGGKTWVYIGGVTVPHDPLLYVSFAVPNINPSPIPVRTLSVPIDVVAYIADKADLDLSETIQIDGYATMEIIYL